MGYRSVAACLVLFGTLLAWPVAAQGQQTSAQTKAAAVARADEGWAHYEAGRYTDALQAFREAEATIHAPPFLLMVARCYAKLGRLLDARAAYQLILDEKLAPDAPPAFREAQATAKVEQAAVELRIPTVELVTTGDVRLSLEATLDGLPVALSTPVQRDPGEYTVVVRAPGRRPLTKKVRLIEGARERIELDQATIDALPAVTPPGSEAGPQPPRLGPAEARGSADGARHAMGWLDTDRRTAVLIGGGAAAGLGLAAGALCTVLANDRASDAERLRNELIAQGHGFALCPGIDPSKCAELKDAAMAKVDLTNVAFWSFVAGGAVGVGTLVYGLMTMSSAESSSSVQVTPLLGTEAAGVSFRGQF
ncbi:hypothetical protein WMF31_29260 [Sorangium sp. So ce1036]|uniref:tetratricopeptide repeat protein n=1 Tax=Sorangium sp. So ce1036 TaxID=3133328 RepID=UPI003F0A2F73